MSFAITPPRGSPEVKFHRTGYFHTGANKQRNGSTGSSPGKDSSFEEVVAPGLGIHMAPIKSVKSPGGIYRASPQISPDDSYSPLPTYSRQPAHLRTPGSATSLGSAFSHSRTDPMTERLIQHRATQAAQWKVHWRTPTMMAVSILTGLLLAIGQHLLYESLHERVEHDESKKIRVVLYGRVLAYLSNVAFSGCLILCYRQRIWRTFRESALSVWSIDQLFLATENPSLFLNWEVIGKAPLATAMALVIWLIPIATIVFSPAALTFGDTLELRNRSLPVPNINFTMETTKDWRVPVAMPDGTMKKSLMFYNTTDRAAKQPGWFDYYDQPSADLKRISFMTAYSLSHRSLNREDARLVSCGGDFNCTYTIQFVAPGYNCEELARGPDDDHKLAEVGAPFNTSILTPRGPFVYHSDVDIGEYARPQPAEGGVSNDGGIPQGPIPPDFGHFKTEPVLWIGYSINSSVRLPSDSPYSKNWTHRYDQHIFACTHYETNYTVKYDYSGPFFSTNVSYNFVKPVVDTNFSRLEDGKLNTSDPQPTSNFISPSADPVLYKKTAAYHALGQRLRFFLRGDVELIPPIPGPSYVKVLSEITSTRLISNSSDTPLEDLQKHLQNFYADMILSLFSAPPLLVVSNETVVVSTSRTLSTFIYNPRKLWACYAPVAFLVFVFLIMGALTIYEDGTTFSVGFSRIMVTTRNTTLDDISRGACLGNDPFPEELMHTRLKFGVLNESGHEHEYMGLDGLQGVGHCAFGVPSEVTPIQRGIPYAGLDRRRETIWQRKEKGD